jgi:hypothetical protein
VYYLEYTEIPKVFFMPHYERRRQHVASLITAAQRTCGVASLLLKRNDEFSNGIQGHCCDNVILRHWLLLLKVSQKTSVCIVAAICSDDGLGSICCSRVPQKLFRSHCCVSIFQQWPQFLLLQCRVSTMTAGHAGCLLPRKYATDTWTEQCVLCSRWSVENTWYSGRKITES